MSNKVKESYFDLTGKRTFFANPYADAGEEFDEEEDLEKEEQRHQDMLRMVVKETIQKLIAEENEWL